MNEDKRCRGQREMEDDLLVTLRESLKEKEIELKGNKYEPMSVSVIIKVR